ncbi:phosphoribosylformylglycinamidine synthase subunit PurQ [Crocosphaera sp. XPORK-15E]|uniref:phosphoribosylformylglycinamidine synthase subunit PurQ n=1 Tax=Crocosphaera sp. XPORK-15E TaxID=3110247 RepID=UPI002B1FF2BA|nr:phosphoribosylformylglycinamidine synthase subunit PurQ [Crocosphaera sp. XPORK-15E]MEA5536209.1 phosphoribosylformylglycinamidine synthase subunit PurQ [Crocosphaera sp. XPORK-15E]
MKFGVIVFPGSNCDRDIATVTEGLLNQPTRMIWHQETDISELDVIVIPGGFSYGDYLRCGAIARFSAIIPSVIEHANRGKLVLGICNGFQVLTEVGLLPGALIRNRDLHFICDRVSIRVENNHSPWTKAYSPHQVITLPIAHGEGRYYGDEDTLKGLEDKGQVLFRYCAISGEITQESNPNGSLNNIAGITNKQGNVLGMMPHPERASDALTRSIEGLKLFEGLIEAKILVS